MAPRLLDLLVPRWKGPRLSLLGRTGLSKMFLPLGVLWRTPSTWHPVARLLHSPTLLQPSVQLLITSITGTRTHQSGVLHLAPSKGPLRQRTLSTWAWMCQCEPKGQVCLGPTEPLGSEKGLTSVLCQDEVGKGPLDHIQWSLPGQKPFLLQFPVG